MKYATIKYIHKKSTAKIHPFIEAEVIQEEGNGANLLNTIAISGAVKANLYGARVGIESQNGSISVAYDRISSHAGAFQGGDIVSPYTAGYATDPLFTTSMMGGLIEKNAGSAIKLTGIYRVLNNQLRLLASYAAYKTVPALANTNETNIDITYEFKENLLKDSQFAID